MIKKMLIAGIVIGGCWASAEDQLIECTFKDPSNDQILGTLSKVVDNNTVDLVYRYVVEGEPADTELVEYNSVNASVCNWPSANYGKRSWLTEGCP